MGKLKIWSGKQVCEILTQYGFVEVRQRGSHIIMQKMVSNTTITVPVPNHKELKAGTLLSIIRQAQVPRTAFE